jgi:hypothetical protein
MSNTHSPPSRRSMRVVRQENPSGPHQFGSDSAFHHAPQTTATGAAITRLMVMVRSAASPVTAPTLRIGLQLRGHRPPAVMEPHVGMGLGRSPHSGAAPRRYSACAPPQILEGHDRRHEGLRRGLPADGIGIGEDQLFVWDNLQIDAPCSPSPAPRHRRSCCRPRPPGVQMQAVTRAASARTSAPDAPAPSSSARGPRAGRSLAHQDQVQLGVESGRSGVIRHGVLLHQPHHIIIQPVQPRLPQGALRLQPVAHRGQRLRAQRRRIRTRPSFASQSAPPPPAPPDGAGQWAAADPSVRPVPSPGQGPAPDAPASPPRRIGQCVKQQGEVGVMLSHTLTITPAESGRKT